MFTVTGVQTYNKVILQTDILKFNTMSKLVLAPPLINEKVSDTTSPRTLTIIANKIEIADQAEITYDLDGRPGLDPDTPAPPTNSVAAGGSNGASVSGEGAYPRAANGGDGKPGKTGAAGIDGRSAPTLEVFAGEVNSTKMKINFKGQDGGRGGQGGNGGTGGNGQKGAASTASDSWYDGDECTREPGRGGNGGRGGDAGYPGRGGRGGNGGIVKIFVPHAFLVTVNAWAVITDGGKGGDAGKPGNKGNGGNGGLQGDQNDPCPGRSEYAGTGGPAGQEMNDIDPNWTTDYKGDDGNDGEWTVDEINGVPM